MSETDLLAGAVAARLRLIDGVQRLYPARRGPGAVMRSAVAMVAAVSEDTSVDVRQRGTSLAVEASVGLDGSRPAAVTAREAVAAVRATLPAGADAAVRIRIASID